jgi:hypothetical protein
MYWHFGALAVLSLLILLGAFYRVSAALFFLAFSYVFLLDQTRYLNHFYLIVLISFVLIFVPAHAVWSIDAWRSRRSRAETVPAWSLWLVRTQIGIAYFFGGIAKLNGDWLRGEPLRGWLAPQTDFPIIGPYLRNEIVVYVFVFGGLFIDLLVPWLVLFRRTRVVGLAAALSFNLLNSRLFHIGIFPWFMIGATTVLLPPSWPRLWRRGRAARAGAAHGGRGAGPRAAPAPVAAPARAPLTLGQRATIGAIAVYMAYQVFMPLRHFLYPGNVSWTEQGHNFSWHMKLRDKSSKARFKVTDPARGATWEIDPLEYLTPRQLGKMSNRPDLILQFCHHVSKEFERGGRPGVEVRALVKSSLNGRRPQLLVDPNRNLAAVPRGPGPIDWIEPLVEEMPPRGSRHYDQELAALRDAGE